MLNYGVVMTFAGFQKLTLLDFPGKTACTVFTSGCNFRCPFCHNAEIAFSEPPDPAHDFSEDEIIEYLEGRKGKIDGVCITGGEPLLHGDIAKFCARVREKGFLVKIDTNGSVFGTLETLVENRLCDYVAMDIKNVPDKYALSAGCAIATENVKRSVELLKQGKVDYEFRTTVVRELNAKEDFKEIAKWLCGAKRYFLQKFKDSDCVPRHDFSAYSDAEMREIAEILRAEGLDCVGLRGVE